MKGTLNRRAKMQRVLDEEVARWSTMTVEQLIARLVEIQNYIIDSDGVNYQFEVQMLENKSDYIHVGVSVDDGRLPAAGRAGAADSAGRGA